MKKREIIRAWLVDLQCEIDVYKKAIKEKESDIVFYKRMISEYKLGRQNDENLKLIQYYKKHINKCNANIEFYTKNLRVSEFKAEFVRGVR